MSLYSGTSVHRLGALHRMWVLLLKPVEFLYLCRAVPTPEPVGSRESLTYHSLQFMGYWLPGDMYHLVHELKLISQVWEIAIDFAQIQHWFESRLVLLF